MVAVNNVTGNVKSDEWYTPEEVVVKCFELLNVQSGDTVMLPFDTQESNFVKQCKNRGLNAICNIQDYLTSYYDYDVLMTNPPFSIKDQVIERVLKHGAPSALILPVESLGGVKRHDLFKQYGYPSIYVPTRRIKYVDGLGLNRKSPNYHSIIMLLNIGKSEVIWEKNA